MGNVGSNTSGELFSTGLTTDGVVYAKAGGILASTAVGTATHVLTSNGIGLAPTFQTVSASGAVVGPGSATDNAVVRFDGTTGKLVQNSIPTIADSGSMTISTSFAGNSLEYRVENTDNTASSDARIVVLGGGASGGDPCVFFNQSGSANSWVVGKDVSDAEKLKINVGGSNPSLGTTVLSISTAGLVSLPVTPLTVPSGGTGATTLTGVLIGNGASAVTGNAITQHDVLLGGASNAITSLAPSATSGVALISQGAAADPAFGTVVVAGGGTGATTLTGVLTGNGTSAVTASTVTQHGVLLGGASNAVSSTSVGSTGQVLQGNTGADPTYSTSTFPSTATSTGTILRADGTNWVATTATYPATTTSQQILYSTAANVVGQLTTANSALAATNSSGTLAMRALSVVTQVFTGSGTYTPTTGMLYCIMEVVGGGGGSGGSATAAAGQYSTSIGGGGGGYSRKTVSAATVGASQSVTVGAGGTAGTAGNNAGGTGSTSSVGAILSATGGAGGTGGASSVNFSGAGVAGGVGSSGDFNINGGASGAAFHIFGTAGMGSCGGSSYFGGNTMAVTVAAGQGITGVTYGSGASGNSLNAGTTNTAGRVGGAGIVVITEFVIN